MKKYEFIFNAEKDVVIEKLFDGQIKPEPYFEKEKLYGRVSGDTNRIYLYFGSESKWRFIFAGKHFFRYYFAACIEEKGNKTVLRGRWRFSIFTLLFSVYWYGFLIFSAFASLIGGRGNYLIWYMTVVGLALAYALIAFFSVRFEKGLKEKAVEYIKKCQEEINGNF